MGYGIAIADWPPEGQVLNSNVLTVVNRGKIHLHEDWEGKWRLAFDTQWPEEYGYETGVCSANPFQVTDSDVGVIAGSGRGFLRVNLLKLPEDQKLGMDHVTHYMDVELFGHPRDWSLPKISLFNDSPLHLAYVQRLGTAGDSPRLVENPFLYVNTRICPGGSDALFQAWGGRERQVRQVVRIAEIEKSRRHFP